jgi:hypothetical protein
MMPLISGKSALFVRANPSLYQEAVYFLGRLVERTLALSFFYHMLIDQMNSGTLQGVEYELARYSHIAIHDLIVSNMHKLIEQKRNTWNLQQLFKEWSKYQKDPQLQQEAKNEIDDLKKILERLTEYRHDHIAHQSKKVKMTMLTVLPDRIEYLSDIVRVMDLFVDGEIRYSLYLHESEERIDLRKHFEI